ncbi:DUF218 domain-containing protein [Alkalibaculum bacchi]|uniref:DUF218 domain-containing protein n=1 Tax=Alkalibaculum bacchi TaxID=645887 RepID=A0A366I7Y1_9FIRM|nr:YdcF family protein [Alkalibaculum bacchi]RBP63346.1 DUF218 domain-containing protein [Alkalibaculum bacchi]
MQNTTLLMNEILHFLADKEKYNVYSQQFDLLIWAGNSICAHGKYVNELLENNIVQKVLITGGVGHATEHLINNIETSFPSFYIDNENARSEAEILRNFMVFNYRLPENLFIIETQSTNTGENALFSKEILKEMEIYPKSILLLQDPLLQKRTKATFRHVWMNNSIRFTNFVPVIPELISFQPKLLFTNKESNIWWRKEYFFSLLFNEISKLHDTKDGYGPKGKNFIEHVDIPSNILYNYRQIKEMYNDKRKIL